MPDLAIVWTQWGDGVAQMGSFGRKEMDSDGINRPAHLWVSRDKESEQRYGVTWLAALISSAE